MILIMVIVVVLGCIACSLHAAHIVKCFHFRCATCGHEWQPRFFQVFGNNHRIGRDLLLKCPKCGTTQVLKLLRNLEDA